MDKRTGEALELNLGQDIGHCPAGTRAMGTGGAPATTIIVSKRRLTLGRLKWADGLNDLLTAIPVAGVKLTAYQLVENRPIRIVAEYTVTGTQDQIDRFNEVMAKVFHTS